MVRVIDDDDDDDDDDDGDGAYLYTGKSQGLIEGKII